MKKYIYKFGCILFLCLTAAAATAQSFIQAYQNRVNLVSQQNIVSSLQSLASFGIKKTGTANCDNAFNWLKNKYLSFGYTEADISEDVFTYASNTSKNLIITKTGTFYPNTYVIVCGHYDTIGGAGVNDNGSGVSVILEIARILKNISTEYSIKFINFSGEEQGMYGSKHYVDAVVNGTNMDIKLVFNIDEVGGVAGLANDKITCERDTSYPPSNNAASATATNELMNCVTLYSTLDTNLSYAYSSDYEPFQYNGEIITGFYEYNESPYPHTADDNIANVDTVYIYNVAQAAVGAVQHFAVADTSTLGTGGNILEKIKIYPNPAKDFINIEIPDANIRNFSFEIEDISGNRIFEVSNRKIIDVSKLQSGVYLGILKLAESKQIFKIIKQKD